jgi:GntP family gluconate:H+ symporter
MITAGGLIGPLALGADLGYSALYLALAIGCGSKPISWANDSGFWVIGRMSGMTPLETFKTVSVMMILMSLVGLGVVLLGAMLFPMA